MSNKSVTWVDVVRDPELLELTQPLKLAGIDYACAEVWKAKVAVDRIVEDLG